MKWGPAIRAACAATAVAGLTPIAYGGLTYDLRFSDGSHTNFLGSPGTYSLELWARISGTNGTITDEGLSTSYITILSSQLSGGYIGSGGLTGATLAAGFNEAGSRVGASADLNGDGILDWGATVTAAANTNYMLVRNANLGGAVAGGTLGLSVNASTWEFKIATFTLNFATFGGGPSTRFNVVQPNAKAVVGPLTYATAKVDGSTFSVTSSNTQGAYSGSTGVEFMWDYIPPYFHWDGGPTGAGTEWLDPANWNPEASPAVPGPDGIPSGTNIARISSGTAPTIGINFAGATNNGPANQQIGQISISNRSITIQNSSTTPGTLTINGADGSAIRNDGLHTLTFANGSAPMTVLLKNGDVYTGTGTASIVIDTALVAAPGVTVNVTGAKKLSLGGNSTLNNVNVNGAVLEVPPSGVLTASAINLSNTGQVVNNGYITGPITANQTTRVSGSGHYEHIGLGLSSEIAPGNSVGLLTCTSLTMGAGAMYVFELQSPALTDRIDVDGALTINAGTTVGSKFTIMLVTVDGAGTWGQPMSGFDPSLAYQWVLAESNGILNGGSYATRFDILTGNFENEYNGNFFVSQSGDNLMLNYQPVPEPGAVAACVGAASIGLLGRRRTRIKAGLR